MILKPNHFFPGIHRKQNRNTTYFLLEINDHIQFKCSQIKETLKIKICYCLPKTDINEQILF